MPKAQGTCAKTGICIGFNKSHVADGCEIQRSAKNLAGKFLLASQ